jgi:hypothetical protein
MGTSEQQADLPSRDYATLRALLPETTTLSTAQDLLRQRGISFSASSWEEFFTKRVDPALAQREITRADLVDLLRPEECGPQNIFLYRCRPETARKLLEEARIRKAAQEHPEGEWPLVLLKPRHPQIVDIRLEGTNSGRTLVVKVVMTRVYRRQIEERESDNQVTVTYQQEEERAVNLFRLHASGVLELRIQTRRDTSKYRPDMRLMWEMAATLLPFDRFEPLPLHHAKDNLWEGRAKLAGKARFSHLRLRTQRGNTMMVSAGDRDGDLADDGGIVNAVQAFLRKDGDIENLNVWWLRSEARPLPARDIHMILGGEINELAITSRRTCEDDSYVLSLVDTYNR